MISDLAGRIVRLSAGLASTYDGSSRTVELIPRPGAFPIPDGDLELLHRFAAENPIYRGSYDVTIDGTDCTVYEGDIDRYWLGSIRHESSRAPFSPTWMISAYVLASNARELGYGELIDVGSGDGRIAFCGGVAGMIPYSIEIDPDLAGLQERLAQVHGFSTHCADAAAFDYAALGLRRPVFFIGGLAQMGGADLASGILDGYRKSAGWVLAGTTSPKYSPDSRGEAGWGTLMEERDLRMTCTVTLPTAWTYGQKEQTPYVFAEGVSG